MRVYITIGTVTKWIWNHGLEIEVSYGSVTNGSEIRNAKEVAG